MSPERTILSLGPTCRAGYQTRRHFGKYKCTASLFDRQITPASALIEYLSNDFHGMFEREDLEPLGDMVVNRRYGTIHVHEFAGDIDEGYAEARKRHDALCDVTRAALKSSAPLLLVVAGDPHAEWVSVVRDMIARQRTAEFDLLVVNDPSSWEGDAWRGDNEVWTRVLQSIAPPQHQSAISYQFDRLASHIGNQWTVKAFNKTITFSSGALRRLH